MKTRIGYDLANGDVLSAVFIARALERALRFGASDRWVTDFVTLDHLTRLLEGDVVIETRTDVVERVVLDLQHAVVSIVLERRSSPLPMAREPIGFVTARRRQAAPAAFDRAKS
ncbi:MAG: hypothetical protein E6J28_01440 [Chloroflexi bacterium]|nr:MAG: hypothetical protein E6J28_01440 [Chloroflexota bacterium]